jgi:hypothetical protein
MARVVEQGGKVKTTEYCRKSEGKEVLRSREKGGKCNHKAETWTHKAQQYIEIGRKSDWEI